MSAAHDIAPTRMSEPRIATDLAAHVAQDLAALDAGLAIASRCEGLTFIALPAPVIAPTAIVDEFRDAPLVSWASGDLTLVGVGIAREVRGRGEHRWAEVIANAHSIATNTEDVDDEPRDTMPTHVATQVDDARSREALSVHARSRNASFTHLAGEGTVRDVGSRDDAASGGRDHVARDATSATTVRDDIVGDSRDSRDEAANVRGDHVASDAASANIVADDIFRGSRDDVRDDIVGDSRDSRDEAVNVRGDHVARDATSATTVRDDIVRDSRDSRGSRDAVLFDGPHRAVIAGEVVSTTSLGFARPRFIGGAAFTPGAADRAPWTGFGDAWFALPRWTYVHDGVRAYLVLAVDARDASDAQRWRDELAIHRAAFAASTARLRGQHSLVELAPAPADAWRTQVTDITDAIAQGTCSKIVAARTCSVLLAGSIRTAELLAALDDRHADCVRVLIKPPGAGALVAATPERLVRRDGDFVLCDALAGSIAPNGDPDAAAARLFASAKDRNEHELVVDALRTALTDAGAHVEAPSEPTFKRLRHIIHLHTPFHAVLRTPRHVLELAARLHPTPAVGGTPQALAASWIETHEPEARGWYSAPVGWFDLDGNGELAVALRCGLIAGNRAHLWAGGGIVAGSDPDRELAETEMKFRAMLNALGVNA